MFTFTGEEEGEIAFREKLFYWQIVYIVWWNIAFCGRFILEQFTVKAHPGSSHSLKGLFNIYWKNERTECNPSQFGRIVLNFFKNFKKTFFVNVSTLFNKKNFFFLNHYYIAQSMSWNWLKSI